MNKLLGLDIGDKRIGVAISEDHLAASYGVVQNDDLPKAISEIGRILRAERIEKIVVGIPKNKDTFQADKIHKFALELAKNLNVEIVYVDETLTSKEAERRIKDLRLNPKTKDYREKIDKLSAQLLLEQFLKDDKN